MPRYSRAFFLCLPLLALAACEPSVEAPAGAARPAASVTTQTLAPQVIEERLPALGTLLARESVQITSTVNEKVRSLHFDEGQYVEKGALLAVLEQAEEQAQLASAKADLAEQDREINCEKNDLCGFHGFQCLDRLFNGGGVYGRVGRLSTIRRWIR